MSRQAYIRASLAVAVMELFPPRIRGALISDPKVKAEYGISTDAVVLFGDGIAEFQRSVLFDAVRRLLDGTETNVIVEDKTAQAWRVEYLANETPPRITIAQGARRFFVVHLILLSPDRDLRLRADPRSWDS